MPGFIGWMQTPEFRRHLLTYIPLDALLLTTMSIYQDLRDDTRAYIADRVNNGEMIFHRGVDIVMDFENSSMKEKDEFAAAAKQRNTLVTQVVFFHNILRVGDYAFFAAASLVIIDIPEGVTTIGQDAFTARDSLTTVSFTPSLTSIKRSAFRNCSNLDNVDLRLTNLQELGDTAFGFCVELKSMTIPDSLQTFRDCPFINCFKLVPPYVDTANSNAIVAHLRAQQALP
ncbi:hypothetical protein TrLO_g4248 [Triparma laevis f. longispina]|nr:hypothetical protein TrLO_g4248 [Triparma laevis f. longispina]